MSSNISKPDEGRASQTLLLPSVNYQELSNILAGLRLVQAIHRINAHQAATQQPPTQVRAIPLLSTIVAEALIDNAIAEPYASQLREANEKYYTDSLKRG